MIMDRQSCNFHLLVERKQFTFDLEENSKGAFLRISEEVSGCRNSIVIPATGLELFRDSLYEVIMASRTQVGSVTALSSGQPKADTPTPDQQT